MSMCIIVLFCVTTLAFASPTTNNNKDIPADAPVKEVAGEDDNSKEKPKGLGVLNMIEDEENDIGKAIPHKIPSVHLPHPPSRGKSWGRNLAEEQWKKHQAKLNSKAMDTNKRVSHTRNSINENRHDRANKKIPRHTH